MSVDTVGNFFTTIRNAIARISQFVHIPYSKFKYEISLILLEEGYVTSVAIRQEGEFKKIIVIGLKYVNSESVIHEIKQISKPGKRLYVKSDSVPIVIGGLGIAILTTSCGVMSNKKSQSKNIGGELICTVW